MTTAYDTIGKGYTGRRSADPRINTLLRDALGNATRILNIGAGTGSYEPVDRNVTAVEPSHTMISQRPREAAPVVQACAEQLPFANDCFDLAMGILTLHHWSDWRQGLREAARVTGGRVLLLTWFGYRQHFWLTDYFPEIIGLDNARFPELDELEDILGEVDLVEVPIPHDCTDGFMCAYWRRPEAYLDPAVRNSISTFSLLRDADTGLKSLQSDLSSGRWRDQYGELLSMDSFDHGYRLVRTKH